MIGKSYDGTLVQRRRRDGRRGPQDDRPGLGDLVLVHVLAHRRHPPQHELPGRQPEPDGHHRGRHGQPARRHAPRAAARSARRSTTTSPTTPTSTPATVTRTATSTSSGATATTTRTRRRSRPPSSPRTASRTTTSAWTTSGKWWAGAEGQRRQDASCGCCARATPTRSSRAAPSGSTPCTAGSTTTSTASTTASRTSRPSTIEDEKDVWKDYASWPIQGTQNVNVFLRGTDDTAAAGTLGGMSGGAADT